MSTAAPNPTTDQASPWSALGAPIALLAVIALTVVPLRRSCSTCSLPPASA